MAGRGVLGRGCGVSCGESAIELLLMSFGVGLGAAYCCRPWWRLAESMRCLGWGGPVLEAQPLAGCLGCVGLRWPRCGGPGAAHAGGGAAPQAFMAGGNMEEPMKGTCSVGCASSASSMSPCVL